MQNERPLHLTNHMQRITLALAGAGADYSSDRYRLYEFVVTANGTVDIMVNVNDAGEAVVTGFGRASIR